MSGPQASLLPGAKRLHLNHGPIDLIIEVWGGDRQAAFGRATARFDTLLDELVAELPDLRAAATATLRFSGPTARRMHTAVSRFSPAFITPMAAVAGAVADEMLAALTRGGGIAKAYVNNGGDIAFHLTEGHTLDAAIAATGGGNITILTKDPVRGIATSGWRGRSHSLGIADAVCVLAADAASADAAATLIANAVNLPGHHAISRTPAIELSPDSDLGEQPVTTGVGPLSARETATALHGGATLARAMRDEGLIFDALLTLNAQNRQITQDAGELTHA